MAAGQSPLPFCGYRETNPVRVRRGAGSKLAQAREFVVKHMAYAEANRDGRRHDEAPPGTEEAFTVGEPPRRYGPYALAAHKALDAATARRVPQAAQGRVDPRRAIASTMCQMEALDLGEQSAIGRLARAFRPAAPSIISRRRDGHDIAQDANWEDLALRLDDAEFHFGGSEKMRRVLWNGPPLRPAL